MLMETETKSLCFLPHYSNLSLHFLSHSQTNHVTLQKSDGLIIEQELYMIFPLSTGRRVDNRSFVCRQNCTKYVNSLPADWVPGFLFRSTWIIDILWFFAPEDFTKPVFYFMFFLTLAGLMLVLVTLCPMHTMHSCLTNTHSYPHFSTGWMPLLTSL